jgi:hypothetical protein
LYFFIIIIFILNKFSLEAARDVKRHQFWMLLERKIRGMKPINWFVRLLDDALLFFFGQIAPSSMNKIINKRSAVSIILLYYYYYYME